MPRGDLRGALGAQIVDLVERHHYDRRAAAAWARKHRDYAQTLPDSASIQRETRVRLAELGSSHTELYTPDDPGYPQILGIFEHILLLPSAYDSIGLEVALIDGEWFATYVFPGGPAESAGILRGDRMVNARGEPFHPVLAFRSRSGQPVGVGIQRAAGGPLLTMSVVPIHTSPTEEWRRIQQRSTARFPTRDNRVGYCMLWCCAGEEPEQMLREALNHELREADALILDLRDGWGGCNPSLLELLQPVKKGGRDRRLILLINRRTRSGKEVVARLVQKRRWGTVLGERTAGAMTRGRPFVLHDGSVLYLAVEEVDLEGERLEGSGVEPDLGVACDPRYSGGRDLPLEAALNLISGSPPESPARPERLPS